MHLTFVTSGKPRTDDSNFAAALGMRNDDKVAPSRSSHEQEALLTD